MFSLIAGLILFVGAHSVSIVAPAWRDRVVARLGRPAWQGIFSLVSLAGLILIVTGYADSRGQTSVLYVSPLWLHSVSTALMLPVFPLLLAAYLPGHIRTLTRHPMLIAVKLWAVAHLLVNGSVADLVLFGSLLLWAGADRASLKRRPARPVPSIPRTRWNDWIAVIVGIVLYSAMLHGGHAWLIGMPLVAGM